jgi:hypothetical protein
MSTIPSLALIPSGVKASKVYSVLPTDGSGDFDFTRSGNATRVNSEGLIELVSTNVPRLNYPLIDGVVSGCPSLLLEPSRSNLVSKSKDINTWSNQLSPTSTANDTISPDGGLNADKITSTVLNSAKLISVTTINATVYSISVFVKNVNSQRSRIEIYNSPNCVIEFNWINNTPFTHSVTTFTNVGYEYYGNGWWRITANFTATGTSNSFYIYPDRVVGTNSIYAWGAQLEQGSYPTSYIPTLGTTATRSAETCNNAGDVNTFNDSEGVLMAELSRFKASGVVDFLSIGIGDGTGNNQVIFKFRNSTNTFYTTIESSNGTTRTDLYYTFQDLSLNTKIAVKYKTNDFALWVNGYEVATSNNANSPIGLNELNFETYSGAEKFQGNTKQLQYFPTALNDSDLETLTSWDSFSDMATSQLYTIE